MTRILWMVISTFFSIIFLRPLIVSFFESSTSNFFCFFPRTGSGQTPDKQDKKKTPKKNSQQRQIRTDRPKHRQTHKTSEKAGTNNQQYIRQIQEGQESLGENKQI